MKAKKIVLATLIMMGAIIVAFAIGLKPHGIKNKMNQDGKYIFSEPDTLKEPEVITEQRTKKIEIINGKKKVTETIVKMKGDSIIEKKVIEKEEDSDQPDFNLDTGAFSGGFYFKQLNPDDLDSLSPFGQQFFNFNDLNDSLLRGFNFSFGPDFGFHIKPFGNFDDDMFKDFDNGMPNMDFGQMHKRIEEMMERMQRGFQTDPNFDLEPGLPKIKPHSKTKSMKQIITAHLLDDGFIDDVEDNYKFELNQKWLKINGKKQSKELYEKYKKIIEDNTGVELEDEFDFKFNNKKKFGKKTRKI
ncbi:MAG TPA: hypothetical protein ENK91_01580 [Bacteroidetes bacterium]|nr:hypothetical protein [Bacteroidota bacterium]